MRTAVAHFLPPRSCAFSLSAPPPLSLSLRRYNYIIVVGAEEEAANTVNIRTRANERLGTLPIAEFQALLRADTVAHK